MKKVFLFLSLLTLSLTGCGNNKSNYSLKGKTYYSVSYSSVHEVNLNNGGIIFNDKTVKTDSSWGGKEYPYKIAGDCVYIKDLDCYNIFARIMCDGEVLNLGVRHYTNSYYATEDFITTVMELEVIK